jgi:hypothetical protein
MKSTIIISKMATHIDIVVDRSGSMANIFTATLAGINEFIYGQSQLPTADSILVSLIAFDHTVERPIHNKPIKSVTVDPNSISPRGNTALYDAIGSTFESSPSFDPRIVVILTDGKENSSKKFTCANIMEQINERRRHGWTFIFLGANQDAIATGAMLGIPKDNSCTFDADSQHVTGVFRSATSAVQRACTGGDSAFTLPERQESSRSHSSEFNPDTNYATNEVRRETTSDYSYGIQRSTAVPDLSDIDNLEQDQFDTAASFFTTGLPIQRQITGMPPRATNLPMREETIS